MNILYIAFPCNPYIGSECKTGWNLPLVSAQSGNKVHVITIKKNEKDIEKYCKDNNINNVKYYYVDISDVAKKLFEKIPTFKLNLYHSKAIKLAKKLCDEENVDIIHQLTPGEFRSVGNYGKIQNVKFVVGPIGGAEYIHKSIRYYYKDKFLLEFSRKVLNNICKLKDKLIGKFRKCDKVLFINEETKNFLNLKGVDTEYYSELGLDKEEIDTNYKKVYDENKEINFIVAGRLVYRKGHKLLLYALEKLPEDVKYHVSIVGDGPERVKLEKQINSSKKLKEHVSLMGKVPFEKMCQLYREADVTIMPSIREASGTVIIESLGRGIPIMLINAYGGKMLLDNKTALFYDGNTKEELINSFKEQILYCINNKKEIYDKRKYCIEQAKQAIWSKKIDYYNDLYKLLMKG